jgi:hypothetical protein
MFAGEVALTDLLAVAQVLLGLLESWTAMVGQLLVDKALSQRSPG